MIRPTSPVWMFTALVAAASGSLFAQSSGLSGPLSGFIFDAPSQSVRLVQGALGATTLSGPVLEGIRFASISPSGRQAIACGKRDCFAVTNLGNAQQVLLSSIPEIPEGVSWSGDSSTAVLYSRTGAWLRGIKHRAEKTELSFQLNLPGNSGPLVAVAVNADGQRVAIALGSHNGGLFEVTSAGSLVPVAGEQHITALSFAAASPTSTLYALDASGPAILKIQLPSGLTERWSVPLSDPLMIQFGKDSAHRPTLYVEGGSDHALLSLDPTTGGLRERIELSFSPSRLEPLGENLLLTSRTGPASQLWTFVPGRGTYFIPAPAQDAAPELPRRR